MMSKQLAISSAFATFAMAALAVYATPDHSGALAGNSLVPVQAELPSLDLPQFPLLSR